MIRTLRFLSRELLGQNRRARALLARYNPRAFFQVVDHKLKTKAVLHELGLPIIETLAVYHRQHDIARFAAQAQVWEEFVIKPAQGARGQGVVIVTGRQSDRFVTTEGRLLEVRALESHLSDILGGIFSLNQRYDDALVERRLHAHPLLARMSFRGLPDIRVIVFRGVPLMAMLRLATRSSKGRANLHAGGIGVGIDLASGRTTHAIAGKRRLMAHLDTHTSLGGFLLPRWDDILTTATRAADAVALGYLGVDLTLDHEAGLHILELNARPGLSIQLANRRGLRPLIEEVEQCTPENLSVNERVQLGREITAV